MNNFDKIIKQKTEQFEVPFNEAHWAEMNGKLNAIRVTKIKNTILGIAAVITIIGLTSYFVLSDNETSNTTNSDIAVNNIAEQNSSDNTTIIAKEENNISDNKAEDSEIAKKENPTELEGNVEPEVYNNSKIAENNISEPIKTNNTTSNTNLPDHKKANAEFIVYNNRVCLGEEVSFESQENEQPVSYTWNFGDGTTSHEKNPKHRYRDSHVYSVTLSLINRQTGEEATTIQNDVVTIMPNPKANFVFTETSIKHDDNKLKYPYTTFFLKEENKECSYKWNYGNGEQSSSAKGKTIYKKTGEFTATLIAKNNTSGCNAIHKKKNLY